MTESQILTRELHAWLEEIHNLRHVLLSALRDQIAENSAEYNRTILDMFKQLAQVEATLYERFQLYLDTEQEVNINELAMDRIKILATMNTMIQVCITPPAKDQFIQ